MNNQKVYSGFIWKLLERVASKGIVTVVSIVLARLLLPEQYGALAIMLVFTQIANSFVQSGFGRALVQKKDPTELDYSSVLYTSLFIAVVFYAGIFAAAPAISRFYDMPDLVAPLRVLALSLFASAVTSVQNARFEKKFAFKTIMRVSLISNLVSGAAGICMAMLDFGIWALVAQQILTNLVYSLIVMVIQKGLPFCGFSLASVKALYKVGWNIFAANMLNTIYNDLRSLIVGKLYSSAELGNYTKGLQLPQTAGIIISDSVKSVMLPFLSSVQDEKEKVKAYTRKTLRCGAFVIFPLLFGFAAVSRPFTLLLLGEQWINSVPYARIYAIGYAFYAYGMMNAQAFIAQGRSDLFLKYDGLKKIIGILLLITAQVVFGNVYMIAIGGALTFCITPFLYAYPNKMHVNYAYKEQAQDILPSLLLAALMLAVLTTLDAILTLPSVLQMIILIIAGIVFYVVMAYVLRFRELGMVLDILKKLFKKRKGE